MPRPAAPRLAATFAITAGALFMFALDRLIVVTALPDIQRDLGASLQALEWTVSAYTLTFTVLLLAGAALGDRFGRRRMFTAGRALFTAGSAAAALAPTAAALVAARALQGVGGSLIAPLSLTILSAATPAARRGAVLGAWGAVAAAAAATGPVVGGVLAGAASWHWIFWLNVPVGLALIPLARRGLDESHGPHGRLDLTGIALSGTALLMLVWGLVEAGRSGWSDPPVLSTLFAGIVGLAAFAAWERQAPAPMLPLRFFRRPRSRPAAPPRCSATSPCSARCSRSAS
ncbi:MAG TPA: MFS transporter [Solirubrobacteraceae bacterium]